MQPSKLEFDISALNKVSRYVWLSTLISLPYFEVSANKATIRNNVRSCTALFDLLSRTHKIVAVLFIEANKENIGYVVQHIVSTPKSRASEERIALLKELNRITKGVFDHYLALLEM